MPGKPSTGPPDARTGEPARHETGTPEPARSAPREAPAADEGAPAGRTAAGYRRMGDAWLIATVLPAAIGIGYLTGRWLDKWLDAYPWFTVIFSAIGIAAGFREVIRIALRVGREEDEAARRNQGGR